MNLALQPESESLASVKTFRSPLLSRGYQEIITYSFIDPSVQSMLDPEVPPVSLTNPISSDMAVMRTNLWPGLLTTAGHNLNRQQTRVRIFEFGQCFVSDDKGALSQANALAGLICGSRSPDGWAGGKEPVDFYDLKGDVEAVFAQTSLATEFSFTSATHPALHPGQSAIISRNNTPVGWIGQLHPEIQKELGLSKPAFIFQVDFDQLSKVRIPHYRGVSKFPEVKRDLSFLVAPSVSAVELTVAAKQVAGEHLTDLKLFDVYQIKDVDNKGKSIALGLTFQHVSRTLTDEEVNQAVESVVDNVKLRCDADLRI
jgi:phenylalanyl-tRNA synthetase beta chain